MKLQRFQSRSCSRLPFRRRRRGVILITALGIIVVLSGLVVAFAASMRTESMASANRVSYLQADAIEQGAEQWTLAQVGAYQTDALSITQVPAAGLQVGNGYFWILQPDPQSDQAYQFGIVDESSKLNLNSAPAAELVELPTTLAQDVADAMVDWCTSENKASADGAESSYYESLQEPYSCKNAPYETVEELLLVKGVTPQLLFGYDLNRNGVIDPQEASGLGSGAVLGATTTNDSRGIFNYLTVYSTQPASGKTKAKVGLINVNTAPEQVLVCLPGLTQSDATALINARASQTTTNTSWVSKTIAANKAAVIAPLITATSYQYSADIVAVSGDGRSFKRVRIVVDCTQTPAKIVYRKDLTSLGWPLPQDVRDSLRAGQGVPAYVTGTPGAVTAQ